LEQVEGAYHLSLEVLGWSGDMTRFLTTPTSQPASERANQPTSLNHTNQPSNQQTKQSASELAS
jgi:hypothetical protein